jgi:hypothetical protein
MPVRVKPRPLSQPEAGIRTPSPYGARLYNELPEIDEEDNFRDVIKKLSVYVPGARGQ